MCGQLHKQTNKTWKVCATTTSDGQTECVSNHPAIIEGNAQPTYPPVQTNKQTNKQAKQTS
jgi:hypothetical protein